MRTYDPPIGEHQVQLDRLSTSGDQRSPFRLPFAVSNSLWSSETLAAVHFRLLFNHCAKSSALAPAQLSGPARSESRRKSLTSCRSEHCRERKAVLLSRDPTIFRMLRQ